MRRLFITVVLLLFFSALIYNYTNSEQGNNEILLTQSANHSSGSYWEYNLSTEDIIKEKQYYESTFPINFGPGYKQSWLFEVIGEGEVTIDWMAYSGKDIDNKKSYNITYHFDNDGNCTVVSLSD